MILKGAGVEIVVKDLGVLEYEKAWAIQRECHQDVLNRPERAFVLVVEHPAVITLGRNKGDISLITSREILNERGIAVVQTDRGGDVTGHFPGQLVVYPILCLDLHRLSPKAYVHKLEQAMIETLGVLSIQARRDPINSGVWVGVEKIGAVGIRIKERVSMHGIALNVVNNLDYFHFFVPCGIKGRGVTSVANVCQTLGIDLPSILDVKAHLVKNICKGLFDIDMRHSFFKTFQISIEH